jgi:DNA-directed RNA polymerase subunit RPC12/RpoP
MGDMTVAYPTTGIAPAPFELSPLACSTCGTHAADSREPFCAHCGSRIAVPVRSGIASLAATRALQFAVLVVVTNILVGGASFGVVYLLSDSSRLTEGALGLEALRFVIVGTLIAITIRQGVRGLGQTRDGVLRRRSWAVIALVVASFFGLLIAGSLVATAFLYFVL